MIHHYDQLFSIINQVFLQYVNHILTTIKSPPWRLQRARSSGVWWPPRWSWPPWCSSPTTPWSIRSSIARAPIGIAAPVERNMIMITYSIYIIYIINSNHIILIYNYNQLYLYIYMYLIIIYIYVYMHTYMYIDIGIYGGCFRPKPKTCRFFGGEKWWRKVSP
jgi:hypothetical protein